MGQRSAASSRAAERSAMMQQKRKVVDAVRGRFARFGDEVLSVVLAFALQPRSMPVLLQRLNIRPAGNLEAQLDAVWEYIAQNSSKDFIKHVKYVKKRDVEAFDISKLMDNASKEIKAAEGVAAATSEAPESAASAETADPSAGEPVAAGGYHGPERRSGADRRKRNDRRHDVEAINRNRRFGGERRKRPRGRRKSD